MRTMLAIATQLILLNACGGTRADGTDPTAPPAAPAPHPGRLSALPALAGLDAQPGSPSRGAPTGASVQRSGSAVVAGAIALDPPFQSAFSAFDGTAVSFDHQPGAVAYVIYRLSPPAGVTQQDLISISAQGDGNAPGMWLLAADYERGCWMRATRLLPPQFGSAQIDLAAVGNPLSPAGFVYCALVVPASPSDGLPAVLNSLTFSYNETPPTGPTYHVAMPADGGDDANDGSAATPWATLQHAADSVVANDTVVVLPGQYQGFMLRESGAPGQPITFSARAGARIVSDNPTTADGINIENWDNSLHDIVVEGFEVIGCGRAGIRVVASEADFSSDIIIRDNTCTDNRTWGILSGFVNDLTVEGNVCSGSELEHGIYLSNSGDGNIVRGNVCFGNHGCGIQFNADVSMGADGTMSGALIEYNTCFNNAAGGGGGAAINLDGVADSVIRGNLLYDNHAGGLVIYNGDGQGSQDNLVLCNTIRQPGDGRWAVLIGSSPGNALRNNIILSEHATRGAITIIDPLGLSGLDSDYNILISRFSPDDDAVIDLAAWRTTYGQDLHSAVHTAAELFLDPAADDYRLKAGSPAIDFGADHPANPPLDLDSITRPRGGAIDAGALEYAP
jgi:parallel beta-helix repeat protein